MEMEVLAAGTLNDVIETGLEDGKFVRIPGVDALFIHVDHVDLNVRAT